MLYFNVKMYWVDQKVCLGLTNFLANPIYNICRLAFCCCLTNEYKLKQLKTIHTCYLVVSIGQCSGHSLAGFSAQGFKSLCSVSDWTGYSSEAQVGKSLLLSTYSSLAAIGFMIASFIKAGNRESLAREML